MSRTATRTAAVLAGAAGMITLDTSKVLDAYSSELRKHRDAADEIVAKVTTEDREFTKDEETAIADHQAQAASYQKRMDMIRKQVELHEQTGAPGEARTRQRDPGGRGTLGGGEDAEKERRAQYRSAFLRYLRWGVQGCDDEQRSLLMQNQVSLPDSPETRDMSAITGNLGGFMVPDEPMVEIDMAMKSFSGVAQSRSRLIITPTGADLPWPTVNDTAVEGELVAENTSITVADPAIGQVVAKSSMFSSKLILVPLQLLQDAAFNIESLLAQMIGERLGRITNRKFTVGTGANEPQGIVTGSTLGKTAAGAAAITYDELIDLQHSVDPAYRANAEWMFHDTTWSILRKLKDSDGRPIWQQSASASLANAPEGLLLGRPFWINQHMAVPASGARSVIWGDLSKYLRRQVRGLTIVRLTERYAEKLQVGFFAFLRADGRMIDAGSNPVKHLVHP